MSAVTTRVTLGDGASVELTRHPAAAPIATALLLPGLGIPVRMYRGLAEALAAQGVSAAFADPRGHGSSSVRPSRRVDFGYATLAKDALRLLRVLGEEGSVKLPRLLIGHSLGGQVAAVAAATAETGVVGGLCLVACSSPYRAHYSPKVVAQISVLCAAAAASRWLGTFPGGALGLGGAEASTLMREWAALATTGTLTVSGVAQELALARVTTPVWSLCIERDEHAPRAATEHLLSKLSSAPIERQTYGEAELPREALDHIRWLRHPARIAEAIAGFARGLKG